MHDTSFSTAPPCTDLCDTTFDPRRIEVVPNDSLSSVSDPEFIAEYRRRLSMVNIRIQSDYSDMQSKYQFQQRRLDALEGLVPTIHMQNQHLQIVTREVRAVKRLVMDMQCALETKEQPLIKRLFSTLANAFRSNRVQSSESSS